MLKPLKWAAFATLVNVLLGASFIAYMHIKIQQWIAVGVDLSRGMRVAIGLAAFFERFWWFFVPLIFAGWCILCFTVHFIRSSSNTNAQAASGS